MTEIGHYPSFWAKLGYISQDIFDVPLLFILELKCCEGGWSSDTQRFDYLVSFPWLSNNKHIIEV